MRHAHLLTPVCTWVLVIALASHVEHKACAGEPDWSRWWLMGYGSGNVSMGLDDASATGHALQEDDHLPWTALYGPPLPSLANSILNDTLTPDSLKFMPDPSQWDWHQDRPSWRTHIGLGAGSYGETDATVLLGGALGDSPWRLGLAAQSMHSDGETSNLANRQDDWAQRDTQLARLKTAYVGDAWAIGAELTQVHHRWGDDAIFLGTLDARYALSDTPGYDKLDEQAAKVQVLAQIGVGLTLQWESQYLDRTQEQLLDIDRINRPLEVFGYLAKSERWRHDGQLVYLWDDGSESRLAMVYLTDATRDASVNSGLLLRPLSSQVVTLVFLADQTTRQSWVEVTHDWPVGNSWAMLASVRQVRDEYDRRELDLASAAGLLPGNQLRRQGRSAQAFDNTLGHVQLRGTDNDKMSWSVDLENTYLPGGVSYNLVSGERRPYREETGIRMALTWQWENDRGFSAQELWYLGVNDKQAPLFARRDNPFDVGVINIPRAREWGLRLTGEQAIGDQWHATWQMTWRDTRFTEPPAILATIEGHRWLYTPRLEATLGLRRYLGDHWRAGIEVRRQSGQFTDVDNNADNELPPWTMINANLQYLTDHWLVTLWGANLTDEMIFSYRSPADNFGVLTLGKTLGLRVEWQQ